MSLEGWGPLELKSKLKQTNQSPTIEPYSSLY